MKKISLREIFTVSFYSSLIAFGGGYITIPVLEKEYNVKRKAIEKDAMQDVASIAQSAPGSISVSLATGLAYKMRGLAGALTAFIATMIPPVFIIILVAINYKKFIDNPTIQSIFSGLELGVVVIMLKLITDMMISLVKRDSKKSFLMSLFSVFIVIVLKVPIVSILVINFIFVQFFLRSEGEKDV